MKILRSKDGLYYRGNWDKDIFKKSIAVVGSRSMTRYGKETVDKFVSEFVANGVTTISGFMYGVDTEVHQKTVDYGGRTIAVFGCGLDVIYPPENEKLYGQILENKGLVISEYEPSAKPHLWKFPQRNKIVAGLSSLGVLVIEAGEKSGSLITAGFARKMGKKVYAVPGPITSRISVGCNNLIKSGEAIMATSAGDILKIKSTTIHSSPSTVHGLSPQEAKIYKVLQLEPLDIDEIAMKIEGNIVEIGSVLSIMSLKGLLTESGGKYYLSK
ncbi:DNA-protecting protein DprA [Candidatus Woesebacteria bacterium CG22_combo_CG10-13_8_21_14_all_39_10]|uniref:DNA-protecting protein DprA n=2 Tax=Candidatus Woeseibacteriota TaxID=1752722 RepID=A0A2H0BJV7_9BACT|nr:MAG: DNA-protecting protein DprA [Candidatus Woesebacteria bacterium CG22_combo_CG10-13_8_21_14_all_39_10]